MSFQASSAFDQHLQTTSQFYQSLQSENQVKTDVEAGVEGQLVSTITSK